MIDYYTLDSALSADKASVDAAECHGIVCGLLCCTPDLVLDQVAEFLFEPDGDPPGGATRERTLALVGELADDSRDGLADESFGFVMLLPDEQVGLDERASAMARWTQGFVFGLGIGGLNDQWRLSSDCNELLEDFQQLARAEFDADEAGEADEADFVEVVEFLRAGVLLINRELLPMRDPLGAQAARDGADLADDDHRNTLH